MLNAIKQSFSIVWKHMQLVMLFYFLIIILSLLRAGFETVKVHPIALAVYTCAFVLLIGAFAAGWFFTIKKSIDLDNQSEITEEEKTIQSFGLIKQFFPGIGEYFLSTVGMFVLNILIMSGAGYLCYRLGTYFFGAFDFDIPKISMVSDYKVTIHNYMTSLPQDKLLKLTAWTTYGLFVYSLFQLFTMWILSSLFYSSKNPIKAYWLGVKFFFQNIWTSTGIYLFLSALNSVIYVVSSLLVHNMWLAIIGYILYIYYTTYYIVLTFLYYDKRTKQQKNKNNFDSGFDIDGEKLAGGEDSKDA